MFDIFRDAPMGQIIRSLTKFKLLRYIEEQPGFEYPRSGPASERRRYSFSSTRRLFNAADFELKDDAFRLASQELEHAKPATNTEEVIVDWYSGSDPENPQNWSALKKGFVTSLIWYVTRSILDSIADCIKSLHLFGVLWICHICS